jgi:hypothetical protein
MSQLVGFPNLDGMSERQLLMLTLVEISELRAELGAAAIPLRAGLLSAEKGLSQRKYDEVRAEALKGVLDALVVHAKDVVKPPDAPPVN